MPAENRSKIVVPRELLERIDRMYTDGMSIFGECEEVRALLAQTAHHHGEPVALPERKKTTSGLLSDSNTHNRGWNACLDEIDKLGTLYTHADPGEVERLRNRMLACEEIAENNAKAFAEALTKLAEIIKERDTLKRRVQNADLALAAQTKQVHTLRAQLAERDALLREADEFMYIMTAHDGHAKLAHRYGKEWWDAIDKLRGRVCTTLSASAEPSAPKYHREPLGMDDAVRERLTLIAREAAISCTHRYNYMPTTPEDALLWEPHAWVLVAMRMVELSAPVERDERADFDAWKLRTQVGEHSAWDAWLARAALERKQ